MATLEKIRRRSAILFTVIIVALLAFILGDFFNSSRSFFGPGTAAAKVHGQKIDIQEFNRRVETIRQNMQNQGYGNTDITAIQSQVLNEMVYTALFEEEIDKLGITVTDKELAAAMTGPTTLPHLNNQVQQQFGVMSTDQLHDIAFNPGKNQIPADVAQQLQQYWMQLEQDVERQLKEQKLSSLFMGALTANKLDAKALYDENASTATIKYAKVDYNSLNGDEFKPTDQELKAKFDESKNRFRTNEPVRSVNYILVDIVPSQEDLLAAQQDVEAALEVLNNNEGVDGLSGFFVTNTTTNKKSAYSNAVASAIDSLAIGKARVADFANNTYTLVKLLGKNDNQRDEVTVDVAIYAVANAAKRDSIINVLNSGKAMADVEGLVNSQDDMTVSYLDPNASQFVTLLEGQPTGRWFSPDTMANAQQIRAIKIKKVAPAVTTYDVAEITYQVDPSSTTVNNLTSGLRDFVAANNTADKFTAQAPQEGYHIFPAQVTSQSLSVGNVPDTRRAAKWALNAKPGQVSEVYGDEQTGHLVAVALNSVYDKGYITMSDPTVYEYVRNVVTNDKKAAKLLGDYQGKSNSVEGYAELMKVGVDTAEVTFGQHLISGFPLNEGQLMAAVAAAQKGQLVGPVKSNSAVVVFEVSDIENQGREFDYEVDRARFNQQQGAGMIGRNLFMILLGNDKVQNNLLQFYQD